MMNELMTFAVDWFLGLNSTQVLSLIEMTVLIAAVFAVSFCYRMAAELRLSQARIAKTLSQVESDLRFISMGYSATDERLGGLERESSGLKAAQRQLESRGSGQANYGQAVNLVQRGWRVEDLVSNCGLSRGEAELVYLLHGPGGALHARKSVKHDKVRSI